MTGWRAHRLWVMLLALAILMAAVKAPLLGAAQTEAEQKLAALRTETDQATNALQQFSDDLTAIDKMKKIMDRREAELFLAPVDRLRAAAILEHRAAEARLSHFTYNILPEQKIRVDTIGAGPQELATSKMTLAADVPTDINASIFIDALRRTLPGRITLRTFSLQRINAPLSDRNLHMTADIEWLSNGGTKNLAEKNP